MYDTKFLIRFLSRRAGTRGGFVWIFCSASEFIIILRAAARRPDSEYNYNILCYYTNARAAPCEEADIMQCNRVGGLEEIKMAAAERF